MLNVTANQTFTLREIITSKHLPTIVKSVITTPDLTQLNSTQPVEFSWAGPDAMNTARDN